MNGQTSNTSLTPNTPINNDKIELTCVSWFKKISNAVGNKTCRFLGITVAASAAVFTFIPSLGADLAGAIKRLYDRKIKTPPTLTQNFMPSNNSEQAVLHDPSTLGTTYLIPDPDLGSTYHTVVSQSSTMLPDKSLSTIPGIDHTSLESTQTTRSSATKQSVSPETPRAIIIVGGCGSGKNTLADQIIDSNRTRNKREYVLIDADKEKEKIPRYQHLLSIGDPEAASKVHKQSLQAKNELIRKSLKDRSNIVHTGTGSDPVYYAGMINHFKEAGYYVKVYFVDADVSVCKERAQKRYEQNGRLVPNNVIERSNSQARDQFTKWYKFNAHTSRHYTNASSMKLVSKTKNDWSKLMTINLTS